MDGDMDGNANGNANGDANGDMLAFVEHRQSFPTKRDADIRRQDFQEIAAQYAPTQARGQAARCSQCGVPYCTTHCPLQNHIPDWLLLTAQGRLREAYELSNATSTMPEICGRICPQDRLCEGNCVIEFAGHGAVTIGSVEKYITDMAWQEGWVAPLVPGRDSGQSVAIVGAGPTGLTAAEYLRLAGHDVDIYDRHDRAGGLLTYGIPNFKLEKDTVVRRLDRLIAGGIRFHLNHAIGDSSMMEGAPIETAQSSSLAVLRERYDAVLLATGVYRPRQVDVPGIDLAGVVEALDYLTTSNRKGFGDRVRAFDDGRLNAHGKRVVVIGGGDTAMDCVRTAVRQGAKSVACLYRRDRANMPGSQREVGHAQEEGVMFHWLAAPKEIIGSDGRVHRVTAQAMRLGMSDASGRRKVLADFGHDSDGGPKPDGKFSLDADMVILALGYEPQDLPMLFGAPELAVTRWGTLLLDPLTMMSNLDGVFAGGDIVRGASLVVWGIRDGLDVAGHINRYLAARVQSAKLSTAKHSAATGRAYQTA